MGSNHSLEDDDDDDDVFRGGCCCLDFSKRTCVGTVSRIPRQVFQRPTRKVSRVVYREMGTQTDVVTADALPANEMPYAVPADETLDAIPVNKTLEAIPANETLEAKTIPTKLRTKKIIKITPRRPSRRSSRTPAKQDVQPSNQLARESTNLSADGGTPSQLTPPRKAMTPSELTPQRKSIQEQQVDKRVKEVIKRVDTITKSYDPELQRIIREYALNSPGTFCQDILNTTRADEPAPKLPQSHKC